MSENLITAVIGEGEAAQPERPTWLPEKFKTGEDLAKSYSELEKKFGSVPDEYDISRSIFIDPEKDVIKDLLASAKEKRVPKEFMDKMVDSFDKYLGEYDVDISQEAAKLGDNAKERLTLLDNWAKANLTPSSYKALINNLQNAESINALEELRSKMMSNNTMIPGNNDIPANIGDTIEGLKQEIVNNYSKYKSDEKYRKEMEGRIAIAAKAAGMIDKTAV